MLHKKLAIAFLVSILLLAGPALVTGETIALHPLKGEPYEVAVMYAEVLQGALLTSPGWSIYQIKEDENWPSDVPPGGFSAIICPRPSLTAGSPYAITGEVASDPEYYGSYRLRLYFWEMKGERLLAMDELTAPDKATCVMIMPLLLDNMLPAAKKPDISASAITAAPSSSTSYDPSRWLYVGPANSGRRTNPVDNPEEWVYLGPDGPKWLNVGLRLGGGSAQWFYDLGQANALGNNVVTEFWNAGAAVHFTINLTRFFALQTEANVVADIGKYSDGSTGTPEEKTFINLGMKIPLLLKFNLTGSHLRAGLFAGAYYYVPLTAFNGDALGDYGVFKPDPPGAVFGLNIGWKAGPGNVFLDGRFEYDGLWYNQGRDPVYYRSTFTLSVGYEWGLVDKY